MTVSTDRDVVYRPSEDSGRAIGSHTENGHRDPWLETLRKLAAGLSMDVSELLSRMAGDE